MIGSIHVSLERIQANAQALASLILPAKPAFVVKANAYGHGLTEVARALAPYCDRLCVYAFEEAVALREAGIRTAVFVMGPVDERDLSEALERNIELALWDRRTYLMALATAARRAGKRACVHAKIDTGVTRLGLPLDVAVDAIERYAKMDELQLAGVFSHLAAAEELDSPFTTLQLERFERVVSSIPFDGARPMRHIAASAAAMLWPQTRLDFARIGIALYGLWPSPQTHAAMNSEAPALLPALSFTSEIVATHEVAAGTPVGYGNTYHTPKETCIGVVPLGYADGIPRALSNRGFFIVNGQRVPVAGRVCMNMTMLDLGKRSDVHPGTQVTLIGRDGGAEVSVDDWAGWADTINYEIVARLPERLARSYR